MSCASRWGTIETQDRIVAPAASRGSSVGDGPAIAWLEWFQVDAWEGCLGVSCSSRWS